MQFMGQLGYVFLKGRYLMRWLLLSPKLWLRCGFYYSSFRDQKFEMLDIGIDKRLLLSEYMMRMRKSIHLSKNIIIDKIVKIY